MEIRPVDIDDDAALAEWFTPVAASERADWPEHPGWSLLELTELIRQTIDAQAVVAVARDRRGVVAGSLCVRMPIRERLQLAEVYLAVHPAHRRGGVGRALLAHAERVARRHGRTTVIGATELPTGSPETEGRERFARAAGYRPANAEVRRELRLPADHDTLDRLELECRPHAAGYDIVTWVGPCPDRWVAGRVALARSISTDAPHGELDLEEEAWDETRLRGFEHTIEAMGRDSLTAGAVGPQGDLVGYSQLGLPRADPETCYQFDTVVVPAHRGHRLGMLLKIVNLRLLEARSPSSKRLLTWNAADNEPMGRVNEALGFRVLGTETVWQKTLG
jgi:GNAT superfamily N-acetyltransferase